MVSDHDTKNRNNSKGTVRRRGAFEMTEDPISDGEGEETEIESEAEEFHVVTREEWGAEAPIKVIARIPPVLSVFCLNSFSKDCKDKENCSKILREMQKAQKTEPYFLADIRFNFMIHEDGTIYECRGWGYEPSLPAQYNHYNEKALLIGYFYYFTERTVTGRMEAARDMLIEYGLEKKYIDKDYELRNVLNLPR